MFKIEIANLGLLFYKLSSFFREKNIGRQTSDNSQIINS